MEDGSIRIHSGWIDARQRPKLLPNTEVLKTDGGHLLIAHDSIPIEADHVEVRDGAYVVIPNPDAA